MVEKIIHQVWVGDFKIPRRERALAVKVRELHPGHSYNFWTDDNLPELPENIRKRYDVFYQAKNYVFCADLLRIFLVHELGGFYLDIDFDLHQGLDPFFEGDGCLFFHDDNDMTIPNNLICMKKGSPVLKHCLDKVKMDNDWYGPSWFGATVKNSLGLPNETPHSLVEAALKTRGVGYFNYGQFERDFARHLSLYSWESKTWEKLNNGDQI